MPSERPASGSEPARGGRDGSDGSDGRNGRGEPEKAPRGASRYPALRDPTRHRGGGHGARGRAGGRGPRAGKPGVPPGPAPLVGLFEVNRALVARAAQRQTTTATIDHDGTIIEAHKREAVVAYEGTRGYQPVGAVWVEEDLIVADEFRDGNVPGGKDPLTSVRRAFAALPAWVEKRYFRGDSADYYVPLLKYLVKEQITFSISADMSPELRAVCGAVPTEHWVELAAREREVVHVAEVEFTPGDWPKKAAPLRYVGLRITPLQHEL